MKKSVVFLVGFMMFGWLGSATAEPLEQTPSPGYMRPLPPASSSFRYRGRIRIEKGMNEDGYQLRIYTSEDVDPEAIQVSVQGHSILIESARSFKREERNDHGFFSYSRSSSHFRRRLSLPRNADAENLQRNVEDGVLIITLPYLNGYRR
jgi:hypothetical protein